MSEAYVHGFNLIVEGVRQMRGESCSQVDGATVSLVTSGEGVPTSALLLTKDDAVIEGLILPDVGRRGSGFVLGGVRGRRAPSAGVRVVRPAADAAPADVPVVPVVRRAVGRHVGTWPCLVRSSSPTRRCCPRTAARRRTTWSS